MPVTRTVRAFENRYDYARVERRCYCKSHCGPEGKLQTAWTIRKHRADDARLQERIQEPQVIDQRFRIQPLGRPYEPVPEPPEASTSAATTHADARAPVLVNAQTNDSGLQAQERSLAGVERASPLSAAGEEAGLGLGEENGAMDPFDLPDVPMDVDDGPGFDDEPQDVDDDRDAFQANAYTMVLADIPAAYAGTKYVFDLPESPETSLVVFEEADHRDFWRAIILLILWLHLTYHLPHRGCDLTLRILMLIFSTIAPERFQDASNPALTLNTVMRRLDMLDTFLEVPQCKLCRRIAPLNALASARCTNQDCNQNPFFKAITRASLTNRYKIVYKPILRLPMDSVSSQLVFLLARPQVEKNIDAWRHRNAREGELLTIMDGEVWKNLRAHDGGLFFDNSPDRANEDELRIGITLGLDGLIYALLLFFLSFVR